MIRLLGTTAEAGSDDAVAGALEQLVYFVEDVDNANDLPKINGVDPVVEQLKHRAALVRANAAWVLAAVAHNNPEAQNGLLQHGAAVPELLRLLNEEQDSSVMAKVLGAVSAIVANNRTGCERVVQAGAVPRLLSLATSTSQGSTANTQTRALMILKHLVGALPAAKGTACTEASLPALLPCLESASGDVVARTAELLLELANGNPQVATLIAKPATLEVIRKAVAVQKKQETGQQVVETLTALLNMFPK
eukprot:TRINITY_DN4536_c0_g1_i2.p2 TRINITY_DN4536_c0_g1~~TRINITY_DN4536_c0_g1_i2.p2  ORF type:complete len:250 (+),score=80.99 TRINITY_DN4536_c0_g1_i2:332-1081(+)